MSSIKYLLVMLFSIAVVACGGGGGGSSAPATYAISGTITGASGVVAVGLSGDATKTTNAAANGTYSFTGLANGSYTVTPTSTGNIFTPSQRAVTVSGASATAQDFTATVSSAATYSITGSAGITGATISLGAAGSTFSGTGGAYTFPGLLNGTYTVTPSLTGYTFAPTSASVTINGGNATATAFVPTAIPVPHSISGTVSGVTGGGTTITVTSGTVTGFTGATTTTNSSGAYTVSGLYDGSYTVTPSQTNYTFSPVSTSVSVSGGNATVTTFTGTANSAVQAAVSGTVSGAWIQGVTLTVSGGTTGTQSTNVSGNYSFNLASGQSYTLTPSLPGYTFSPASVNVTVPAGSSTAITGKNFVSSSAIASFSISGTISKTTASSGPIGIRVYNNNCTNCSTVGGTVLAAPGTYTIRGLQNGNYTVVAEMDTLGSGLPNANNPMGTSSLATIASANLTGVNVVVADPTVPAPVTPSLDVVAPGNGSAFVAYTPPLDVNSQEIATSYKVYWGTDPAASTGGSSATFAANGDKSNVYILKNLTDTTTLYFKMTALVGTTESAASPVFGPVTIGATTGANTVSGTVTVSPAIAATGPMYVGVYSKTSGVYLTRIASPSNSQSYSIGGVVSGSYQSFAVIDMNNNGVIDLGDVTNVNGNLPTTTVSGNTTSNITLSSASAGVTANTDFQFDGSNSNYNLILGINDGTKRVVAATLISGPNVSVPYDIGADSGSTRWIWLGTTVPTVGDTYTFRLTYSDGNTQDLSASVTGVLGSGKLAQTPATVTDGTAGSSTTVPLFTWAAPSSPPASFTYRLHLYGNNDSTNWDYPQDNGLPSTTTPLQVLYNADGRASGSGTLTSGNSYTWSVQVKDGNGNSASRQSTYTVP